MAFVLVSVHCKFVDYARQPIGDGTVTFTPLGGWVNAPAEDVDYVPRAVSRQLEDGEALVTLVASSVEGDLVQYRVDVKAGPDSHSLTVTMPTNPADGAVLELADRVDGVLTTTTTGGSGGGGLGGFGGAGNGGFGS